MKKTLSQLAAISLLTVIGSSAHAESNYDVENEPNAFKPSITETLEQKQYNAIYAFDAVPQDKNLILSPNTRVPCRPYPICIFDPPMGEQGSVQHSTNEL